MVAEAGCIEGEVVFEAGCIEGEVVFEAAGCIEGGVVAEGVGAGCIEGEVVALGDGTIAVADAVLVAVLAAVLVGVTVSAKNNGWHFCQRMVNIKGRSIVRRNSGSKAQYAAEHALLSPSPLSPFLA